MTREDTREANSFPDSSGDFGPSAFGLLNDENAHIHSLGALSLMHDVHDCCEQLLRMCPGVDVSASPLLSQGNAQQAPRGQLEPGDEAARALACSDGLVILEPVADAASEQLRDAT